MIADGAVLPLAVEVERAEVHRNLGYRGQAPSDRIARRLDELWTDAVALCAPRGALRVVTDAEVAPSGMPRTSPHVGIGLVTIGSALEAEAMRRQRAGELLDGLLLDAIGSAAAEAAAEALDDHVCRRASALGLRAARRVSPGYGRWDVKGQRELLALLTMAEVGVLLTSGLMMVPSKSVSFAARFVTDDEGGAGRRRGSCVGCLLVDCAYRRVER